MLTRKLLINSLNNIVLFLISLIYIIPLWMVIVNSFSNRREAALFSLNLPSEWLFENYIIVFQNANVLRSMANGLLYGVVSCLVAILVSSAASFVLQRRNTKGCKRIYMLFMVGLVLPLSIIPTIVLTQRLGIYGTYFNMISLYIAFNIPLCVLMYYNFMSTIPRSLDEAVTIDGGRPYQLFFYVIFPLLKPVSFTITLLVFTGIWNDFFFQLFFVRSSAMWSMPMTIFGFFGRFGSEWNLVSANIILGVIPILIIFIAFQKQIVDSLVAGSIKG